MKRELFPQDRKLGDVEKLRPFKADKPLIKQVGHKLGINDDEAKRRALHVGLQELADMLGVDLERKKAA